jgi:hypothetical protein
MRQWQVRYYNVARFEVSAIEIGEDASHDETVCINDTFRQARRSRSITDLTEIVRLGWDGRELVLFSKSLN